MDLKFIEGNLWTARKIENTYIVCLKDFSNIMEGLTDFVVHQKIKHGKIKGIGNVTEAILGFFNPSTKKKFHIKFDAKIRLSEIFGTLSEVEGNPIFYLESILERENNTNLVGHLLDARIIGLNEFFFYPLETEIIKFESEIFGFN